MTPTRNAHCTNRTQGTAIISIINWHLGNLIFALKEPKQCVWTNIMMLLPLVVWVSGLFAIYRLTCKREHFRSGCALKELIWNNILIGIWILMRMCSACKQKQRLQGVENILYPPCASKRKFQSFPIDKYRVGLTTPWNEQLDHKWIRKTDISVFYKVSSGDIFLLHLIVLSRGVVCRCPF